MPYYMINIIYKTVRSSPLKKLQIIQNIYNICTKSLSFFKVNFDKGDHSLLHLFLMLEKQVFEKNAAFGNE